MGGARSASMRPPSGGLEMGPAFGAAAPAADHEFVYLVNARRDRQAGRAGLRRGRRMRLRGLGGIAVKDAHSGFLLPWAA